MTDVLIFQTNDDGDITIEDGVTKLTGGFDSSFFLSLFGGNFRDDGSQDSKFGWWGNILENEPELKYISRTQNLLAGIPASPANLRRIEEAALRDLQWYLDIGIASQVEVTARIPDLNMVEISGFIIAGESKIEFNFVENWKAMLEDVLTGPGIESAIPVIIPKMFSKKIRSTKIWSEKIFSRTE